MQVRDWLYVDDHCSAHPRACSSAGASGETYNIGGWNEKPNLRDRAHACARCSTSCGRVPTGSPTAG
jgi:dTDP-glucose 4,6-dehydratase